jgi:carbon-monoxide dehydrogenase medium subunit
MKPPPFDHVAPRSVQEAVSLLERHGEGARILAGGQSLVPLLNMRLARPSVLIDLNRVSELDYIREEDGEIAIGAMTRKRTVEWSEIVRLRQPLLRAATLLVAHPQIRTRGTVGGSLAHADPAAEYPAVAVATDARLRVAGPTGERTIAARDFFVSYLTTALGPREVLTEVRFPSLGSDTGWSVQEVSRRHGDFAMVGAVATASLDRRGRISRARVVLFGVGATPVQARRAEEVLTGAAPGRKLLEEAARRATEEIEEPLSDLHASAEYRRHLAGVLTRRALLEAAARAGAHA